MLKQSEISLSLTFSFSYCLFLSFLLFQCFCHYSTVCFQSNLMLVMNASSHGCNVLLVTRISRKGHRCKLPLACQKMHDSPQRRRLFVFTSFRFVINLFLARQFSSCDSVEYFFELFWYISSIWFLRAL